MFKPGDVVRRKNQSFVMQSRNGDIGIVIKKLNPCIFLIKYFKGLTEPAHIENLEKINGTRE